MAYCNKCGAYIPDGQTVCLACGYDMEQEKAQSAQKEAAQAAQAAQAEAKQAAYDDPGNYYSFSNEELREKLEEQRKKQQEQSRKWAEQEKQRRERERESVKDNWKTYTTAQNSAPRYQAQKTSAGSWNSTRLMSVLSYVSALFLIPLIFKPEDRKAGFHARQGLRLFIYSVLCDSFMKLPGVGTLLQISRFYLMIKGILNAVNDKEEPLPFIGNIGGKN